QYERKSFGDAATGQSAENTTSSGHEDADDSDEPIDFFGVEPTPTPTPLKLNRNNVSAGSDTRLDYQSGTGNGSYGGPPPPPPPKATGPALAVGGPAVHVAAGDRNIVVDVPYSSGSIVLMSDPYIVSNAGIGLVDNAQLAVNLVSGRGGTIAFDEYHQGYGTNNNQLIRYFEGTPIIAIFLQLAALTALVLFSQSRRFARPLPENEPDRLSKLEYVSAMAELQQRTSAYDLAIENIYADFRRRTSRLVGVDNTTVKRTELSALIAERAKMPAGEMDELMFKCEDIIRGEPTGKRETVRLIAQLREVEGKLGLSRNTRAKI
ncbi:MAG TPA: hypothetical protein VK468_03410, partial [Pyrinomonadaceae bacterium]|nr:hypothetical protein [Pyrinomonadaceae bacterium]